MAAAARRQLVGAAASAQRPFAGAVGLVARGQGDAGVAVGRLVAPAAAVQGQRGRRHHAAQIPLALALELRSQGVARCRDGVEGAVARLPRVQAGHPDLLLVGQLGQAEFAARHHQGACQGLQQQERGQRRTAAPTAGRACVRSGGHQRGQRGARLARASVARGAPGPAGGAACHPRWHGWRHRRWTLL
uniref:Uncharacterized protein n=1 Tax=Ixodes ricinus TaxID=34613 RepID=A0A6B0V190_IXORI